MTATERDRLVVLETKVGDIDKKLDKVIEDHESRIRCLEGRPGKRWETIVAIALTAGITTGINLLLK
jgi:hypothetical protein